MKSRFQETAYHTIVFGVGGALRQAIAFLLIPLYTRYLEPDAFGALALFIIVINLMGIIPQSFTPALFRSYYDCEDDRERRIVVSSTFGFVIVLIGILSVIGLMYGRLFSMLLFRTEGLETLWQTVMLISFLNGIAALGMGILRARKASRQFAFVSVVAFLIQMVATIYLVAVKNSGLAGVLNGYLIGSVANVAFLFPFVIRDIRPQISSAEVAKLFSYGWPFMPTQAMGFITQSADRILLERFASLAVVGVYALSQKLSSILTVLFVAPFSLIALPVVFSAEKDENAKQFYVRLLTYYLLIALSIGLAVSMLADSLLKLVSNPVYWTASDIVPLISLSLILYGARSLIGIGLIIQRKTHYFPLAVGVGMVVNFSLLLLFVPRFHERGAAWASVLGSISVCIVYYWSNRAFYPLPYEWLRMVKILCAAVIVYGIGWIFRLNDPLKDIILHSVLLLVYPALLYLVRFFEKSEIRYITSAISRTRSRFQALLKQR